MNQWILNQWTLLMFLLKILSLKNPKWRTVSNTSQKMGRMETKGDVKEKGSETVVVRDPC
jgi:hypothetical protein